MMMKVARRGGGGAAWPSAVRARCFVQHPRGGSQHAGVQPPADSSTSTPINLPPSLITLRIDAPNNNGQVNTHASTSPSHHTTPAPISAMPVPPLLPSAPPPAWTRVTSPFLN